MALAKIEDFYPNYRDELFDGEDVKGIDVYADGSDEKIGSIKDVLVDDQSGRFRYFVVDTGFWVFGKKVLLPVGRSRIDANAERIYAIGLTKEQVEQLPEFDELEKVDYDYEDRVRGVYHPQATPQPRVAANQANTYDYEQQPSLYGINENNHQKLRLYEERLVANKMRRKAGEVAIGKHVETETARVSVPVEKERVIIERTTPVDAGTVSNTNKLDFQEGEIARMEVYEEVPEIRKEAFVREEVSVRKEVTRENVSSEETLRREELDIDNQGNLRKEDTRRQP
ncbi:photosystem reaction center subunit H [[Phormidium ambiguum] IAM M-71]|uniref:Photosystem reaction center subunit H n=1 Tax=[Phormidium ambiguum] IAM M-71 TaxID=454136 RepID=A0A1U7IPR3_9CYAN|nr:DUF2382 domain-containing protein [Phormidium ambiguum]OKH39325.1 photosystem reaction center subunit H [Phormidium ambiguum IAM M-71]